MSDVIHIDVPTFLRLLELSREDVKDDADLHTITTIVTDMSMDGTVTMDQYEEILAKCKSCKDELSELRRLSGV